MRYVARFHFWEAGEFEALLDRKKAESEAAKQKGEKFSWGDREIDESFLAHTKEVIFTFPEEDSEKVFEEAWRLSGLQREKLDPKMSSIRVSPLPYLTIRELLSAPVLHTEYDFWRMETSSPFPEDLRYERIDEEKLKASGRVRIDYYADHYIDGERGWSIACVFWDNLPVFIYQCAGRSGRDFSRTIMFSYDRLSEMSQFLRTLLDDSERRMKETPLDEENLDLTFFYSDSISRELPQPKGANT